MKGDVFTTLISSYQAADVFLKMLAPSPFRKIKIKMKFFVQLEFLGGGDEGCNILIDKIEYQRQG